MLSGTKTTYYAGKIWDKIDEMPIWNWNKIVETNDLTYLFRNQTNQKPTSDFDDVWEDLQQQHIDEFGVDAALERRLKVIHKIIKLNLRFCETKDRSLFNIIKIEQHRLSEMSKGAVMKFYQMLDFVSSKKGFRIDPKQFTVVEWGYALKNIATNGKGDKGE